MLDFDYSKRLESLIQSLDWKIQLPPTWSNFFDEAGEASALNDDQRANRRRRVRSLGVLHFERQLPSVPREPSPIGVYTRDFSRRGCGFVAAQQIYPQETVRIILPTFWLRLLICRARRVGPSCYEIGGELIDQSVPGPLAFEGVSLATAVVASTT